MSYKRLLIECVSYTCPKITRIPARYVTMVILIVVCHILARLFKHWILMAVIKCAECKKKIDIWFKQDGNDYCDKCWIDLPPVKRTSPSKQTAERKKTRTNAKA